MKKNRNSNIEFLRIISMLFIVISHYTVHNGVSNYELPLSINRFLLETMTLGNIGTILFVLITGYFLINTNNTIKISKIFKLWFQIFFYSIIIYVILICLGMEKFSITNCIKAFLPVTFKEYWFATSYIVLYIFHPFINKMLNSLTKKEHLNLIIIGLIIFSILNMVSIQDFYGNEIIQFILFYNIGAYFGKYNEHIFKNKKNTISIMIIMILLLNISVIAFDLIGKKITIFSLHSTYLYSRTSIITIILSIALFNVFLNREYFYSKTINSISASCFSVYLISDNNYIRKIIWSNIFANSEYVLSKYLILHNIFAVTVTFLVCILIENVRKAIFDNMINNVICKKIDNIQNNIQNLYKKILERVHFVEENNSLEIEKNPKKDDLIS